MGKGKKKEIKPKQEKTPEESLQELSISGAASTSSAPEPGPAPASSAAPAEEEFEGLTGGGARKKRQAKKQAAKEASADSPAPASSPAPAAVPALAPAAAPAPPADDDEPFEGLTGSRGGKKKRPRKKKGPEGDEPAPGEAAPEPAPAAPEHRPQGPAAGFPQRGPPPPFPQQPAGYPPQVAPGSSLGRGLPPQPVASGYPQRPGYPPQHAPPGYSQPPGLPPQPVAPGYPQRPGYPPQHAPGPQPGPGAPGYPQRPAYPAQQVAPVGQPPPQQRPAYPAQQGAPVGQPPPQHPAYPAQQGAPVGQPPPQQRPAYPAQQGAPVAQPPPQQRQATPPAEPQARGPLGPTKCRYTIPPKIIGKTVKARPVKVLCNYLPMKIKPMVVYRYDVTVKPDRPKKMVPVAFYAFMAKHFPRNLVAFDQFKNFYSTKMLPKVTEDDRFESQVEVKDPNGKDMKFEVSIKMTGSIDLNILVNYMNGGTSLTPPTEAIQCMDVVLRQGTLKSYVKAGRTFFRRPSNPLRLGDGLEMWTGLFQSAIFTSRSFINIDVAHKGFPIHQSIAALMEEFRLSTREPLEKQQRFAVESFKDMLKGLRVMACIGGDSKVKREYICNGVGQPANVQKFVMTDPSGREIQMTVADYFAKVKNIRLSMPYMNCLWVGPRDKNIFYPLELLEVAPNQVLNKQLNDRQLATIVKEAATPPDIRKRKIEDIIKDMNYSNNVYYKEFGLQISESFTQVEARVLNAPIIKYADKTVLPKEGVWYSSRMLNAASLQNWGFMAVERDARASNSEMFIKMMQDQGRQMGMQISPPAMTLFNVPVAQLHHNLTQAKARRMQLMVVVLPNLRGPGNVYSDTKKAAELSVGMLTQCVKEQTLARLSPQTAKNILLKVNAKLMGVNHSLDAGSLPACLRGGGVMVVGADVTHPSPDQQNIPSIAAVTASIDLNCFCYNIGLSIQTPKKEVIVEFEDMMVEHLRVYQSKMKALPKKIFVFRDGVSEGQFAEVLNCELTAVYKAYKRLTGTTKDPEVLFLLVQKRHHTRLFVPDSRANVSAGTVVDTDIVHARELDFYLVSHAAIKGTARPTRYYAIHNDGRLPHDEVEQLVYYLCHLYSRCSRSVSYPTPTYYAHLACLRARVLTLGDKHDNTKLEKQPQRLKVLEVMQSVNPMFFV